MIEKRKPFRSKKILEAAKGEKCLLNTPVCNYDSETTVACHSNSPDDGKAGSQKADDIFVAFGCAKCHLYVDNKLSISSKKKGDWYLNRGIKRTIRRLIDKGIIKVV